MDSEGTVPETGTSGPGGRSGPGGPGGPIAPLTRLIGPVPALDVLRVVWRHGGSAPIGTSAVARMAGLARQSAHRLLRSLVARRVVVASGAPGRPRYRSNEAHESWPMLSALFRHEAEQAARLEQALLQAVRAEPAIAAAWLVDEAPGSPWLELVVFVPGVDDRELAVRVEALRGRLRGQARAFGVRLRASGLGSDDFDIGAAPGSVPGPWLRAHERGRALVGPPIERVLVTGRGSTVRRWDGLMVVG